MVISVLGEFLALGYLWFCFLVIAGILSSPLILLGRKRAQWQWWELAVFVVPYWAWAVCMVVNSCDKSLANGFLEMIYIALAVPIAVVVRLIVGHPKWRWIVSVVLIALLSAWAIGLWAFVPCFPE
jgi:hypothetical protein